MPFKSAGWAGCVANVNQNRCPRDTVCRALPDLNNNPTLDAEGVVRTKHIDHHFTTLRLGFNLTAHPRPLWRRRQRKFQFNFPLTLFPRRSRQRQFLSPDLHDFPRRRLGLQHPTLLKHKVCQAEHDPSRLRTPDLLVPKLGTFVQRIQALDKFWVCAGALCHLDLRLRATVSRRSRRH